MEKTPAPPKKELSTWAQNELAIIYVKIALGGDLAGEAFVDYLYRCRPAGTPTSLDEMVTVIAGCLKLEKILDLKFIEEIVLHWMIRAAQGLPIDYRAHDLIGEWCGRRLKPVGPGRHTATVL
jgi:hypothetical protein